VERSSVVSRLFLIFAALLAVSQACALVPRAVETDHGVFYRMAREVNAGAGAELYEVRDPVRHWHRHIPPAGILPFIPLASFSPAVSAGVWTCFNLLVLLGCGKLLDGIYRRSPGSRGASERNWALGVLCVLAVGCLHVGQYGVFFVGCWLLYLWGTLHGRPVAGAWALAAPAAIKLYPLMFVGMPLFRGRIREAAGVAAAVLLLSTTLPVVVYGPRWWPLTRGFVESALFGPTGSLATSSAKPEARLDYSMGAVLPRYLSVVPRIHGHLSWMPHLDLPLAAAACVVQLLRLAVLVLTAAATYLVARRTVADPNASALLLFALWGAASFLLLHEIKGRYAVQCFPAFLPLLQQAGLSGRKGRRLEFGGWCAVILGLTLLTLQFVPEDWSTLGVPLVAVAALWGWCVARCTAG